MHRNSPLHRNDILLLPIELATVYRVHGRNAITFSREHASLRRGNIGMACYVRHCCADSGA